MAFLGNVFGDVLLYRGPWVSLVSCCKRNGEGPLRSAYVDLLGAYIDAVLLSMPIEADLHVINDV